MLFHLLYPLAEQIPGLNLFRYITFRTGGAIMTALMVSFLLGPPLIRWLRFRQKGGQPIRSDGPESHLLTKKGTPTMGGVLIPVSYTHLSATRKKVPRVTRTKSRRLMPISASGTVRLLGGTRP